MGGWGMKGVDTIARVRREHFVRGKTIKEIVRDLHVSRNTVRKILRSGATAFEYERRVQPQPRLGPWREELERLLAANAARPSRERLTLMRLFEELRGVSRLTLQDSFRCLRLAPWDEDQRRLVSFVDARSSAGGCAVCRPSAGASLGERRSSRFKF
jgi:hypothetical protein